MPRGVIVFLGMVVLGVAVFLVYYPAAHGPFILDDFETIVDNPSVRQLWPLVGSGNNRGPLNPPDTSPSNGRPLVNLAMAANYSIGGIDPFGYRIAHMVAHLLSAMILWAILARTLRLDYFQGRFDRVAEPLSFAAAFVWAMHPLHTETLVYVTQRTELTMGLFYLATLYCSMRYWAEERKALRTAYLILATWACLSGMLCKEMMASAPAIVLLYERTFVTGSFRRALTRSWPLYVGLALAWVPAITLNLNGPRCPGAGFGMGATAQEWWFTQTKVLFLYLKLTVWPWPLVIHYEVSYLKTLSQAWPWLLATGILAIGTLVLLWRRSVVGFVALWFFAVLSPTLVFPLVGETVAERRMYVPLAAIVPLLIVGGYVVQLWACQAVAWRIGREPTRRGLLAVLSVATIALVIVFGNLSSRRLLAYRDEFSLWQDAAVHQPHNPLVQLNLGTLFAEDGQLPKAVGHLEEAVRLVPDPLESPLWYAELMRYRAHYNLARGYEDSGRFEEAIEQYRATLKVRPDDAASHYNLARLLENAGHKQQAVEHYRQAIAAQPDFPAAHSNLGIILLTSGHVQEAIKNFEAALRGQENPGNYLNLATAYSSANRVTEAIFLAEKALDLARSQNETALERQIEAALAYFRAQRSRLP
jgi:protein O-mannosyl-transferase